MADNWVLFDEMEGKDFDVTVCTDSAAWTRIEPDMIYNRLDIIREEPSKLLQVTSEGGTLYIPCCVIDNTAILGVWGTRLTMAQVQAIARYIFAAYPEIVAVSSRRADIVDVPKAFHCVNDFHIDLPKHPEEINQCIHAKTRATFRRKMRLAQKAYGAVEIQDVSVNKPEAKVLFDAYFAMKRVTHDREYDMTMEEYLRKYYVTDIYVMCFGERIASLVLLCEQGSSVYLETLTYDVALARFSPGSLLYHNCLKRLVEKGKRLLPPASCSLPETEAFCKEEYILRFDPVA